MKTSSLALALSLLISSDVFAAELPRDFSKISQNLVREIADLQKGAPLGQSIPNLGAEGWRLQVLAEEEAFSRVIEVQGRTMVRVGKTLEADRVVIHGDGIIWVDGDVKCPLIDIKGRGLVIFGENPLNYSGGWIKMDSGALISKGKNNAGVHFRKGGTLIVAEDNMGEVIVSQGRLNLDVGGHQMGDIRLGEDGGTAGLKIGKDLHGNLTAKQSVNLSMNGSVFSNLASTKNLTLSCKHYWGEKLSALNTLKATISTLGEPTEDPVECSAKQMDLDIAENSRAKIVVEDNLVAKIGGNHFGDITTEKGNVLLQSQGDVHSKIDSGKDLSIESNNLSGRLSAKGNGDFSIKKVLRSERMNVGQNAKVKTETLEANLDVKGQAEVKVQRALRDAQCYWIKLGSGSVDVQELNQLAITSMGPLSFKAGQHDADLNAKGDSTIEILRDSKGKMVLDSKASVKVKGQQEGPIFIGADGQIDLGSLMGYLSVANQAKVSVGKTIKEAYGTSEIKIGKGEVTIGGDNHYAVISTQDSGALNLNVQGQNKGEVVAAGQAMVDIALANEGEIEVGRSLRWKSLAQVGDLKAKGPVDVQVSGDWSGDVSVGDGSGTNAFKALRILDSNLWFDGLAKISSDIILDAEQGEEQIRVKGGSIDVKGDLMAHLASSETLKVKARRILGDVHVAETSQIDAIVKGRLLQN